MPSPPPIRRLRAAHYKAFGGAFDLAVRPLTVVFGHNGAGKSALAQLPIALASGLRGQGPAGLPLDVDGLRFGSSLLDLRHGRVVADVSLGLDLSLPDGGVLSHRRRRGASRRSDA